MRNQRTGFTLVELLVVITIIAILLALLAPALDQAVYQAELAVCATRESGIVRGATLRAMDYKRFYPPRLWNTNNRQPHKIAGVWPDLMGYDDDRPFFRGYINFELLHDPLAKRVELDKTEPMTDVYAPYKLWFGWRYIEGGVKKGMYRMGQPFEWNDRGYHVMVGDSDEYDKRTPRRISNHPDRDNILQPWILENQGGIGGTIANHYLSMWLIGGSNRGLLDLNFGFDDGSVLRLANLDLDDEQRTDSVPEYHSSLSTSDYTRVPK